MDCLVTFKDTQSVLQAEQVFMRCKVPFETVPHSKYNPEGCGLAILFEDEYLENIRSALDQLQLEGDFITINSDPS